MTAGLPTPPRLSAVGVQRLQDSPGTPPHKLAPRDEERRRPAHGPHTRRHAGAAAQETDTGLEQVPPATTWGPPQRGSQQGEQKQKLKSAPLVADAEGAS